MNFKSKILIFGHAGGKITGPENTLKAFKKAIQLKADYIELDLRLSKDNEIVIFHDPDTFDITGVPGLVKDKTLKELKTLNVGEGEKMTSFKEVINLANNKINLLLHIAATHMEDQIISLLKEYNYLENTIVSCMIHRYLFRYRMLEPNLKLAALENLYSEELANWDIRKKLIESAVKNNFYAINPEYHIVDALFINYAHERNLKIYPWTVNEETIMRKLIDLGVDGIITDDIPLLNKSLGKSF